MMPGSPAPAHTAQLGARVRYQHLEVTSSKEWATALTDVEDAHGPVSVMVNNAGILDLGPH